MDATILTHLLRTDLLPCAYVPPRHIRKERGLFRYRASLVTLQTQVKNKVQAILLKHGFACPYCDAFGKRGREWLRGLELGPFYRSSGGKTRYGHITKQGSPWLRWALVEAAQVAIRCSPRLKAYYQRITKRKGDRRAIVGLARYLLTILYAMLKHHKPYQEGRDTSLGDMAR